jgi:hypothetical protein
MNELGVLACPRCRAPLVRRDDRLISSAAGRAHACEGFAKLGGKPVLIHFERSIIYRRSFLANGGGNHIEHKAFSRSRISRVVKHLAEDSRAKDPNLFLALLKARRARPVVIVGGGTRGLGSDQLWTDPQFELISFDIHDSPNVHFVADAHELPLPDGSVDGVWIQAVPGHVLDPPQMVSEMHRVLCPANLVRSARTRARSRARNTFHSVVITTASALSSQIVHLLGLGFLDHPDDAGGVDVEVINRVSSEGRGSVLQAVHFVAFGQEQNGWIGPVLPSEARDQRTFTHGVQLP